MSRTAFFYGTVIVALIIVINIFPLDVSQNLVVMSKQADMLESAGQIAGTLSSLKTLDETNVETAVDLIGSKESFRMLIVDGSLVSIYDNSANASLRGTRVVLGAVITAVSGMDVFKAVWRDDVLVSYAVVPVVYRENIIGAVVLYDYDTEQAALLNGTRSSLLRISLFILALTVAIYIPIVRGFASRTSGLLEGIKHVREGNYSYEIEVRGSDELALFAGEFNELSKRIKRTDELRRQFVSDASHELRTPLASIKLMADSILQNKNIGREDISDFVGSISEEAERLTRITERLLTLSRLEADLSVSNELTDLGATVERTLRLIAPQTEGRGISLKNSLAGDGLVLGDRDNVSQICMNLIENAVKYNHENGEIDVYIYPEGESVVLRIEDTGPGVPEEDMPRLFERFYRVDRARSRATGGTGLGLAIVRRSLDLCGADIMCENRDSGGMRFVVRFRAPTGKGGEGEYER